ncbi:hypothetical protein J4050_08290 [Winogradskyella sp. DF17]|uniref:Fibronectin type-III domain-containing protein n=1 Tax=Winogradskyella pelagia TaxID=2819984 RepID=A0ABS3T1W6_9FLAO|nr:hypothetical protein [Winogradskyella sp. DF17]MBO3116742.1 hypothetical protein [Winogradskyella sp. DF17]
MRRLGTLIIIISLLFACSKSSDGDENQNGNGNGQDAPNGVQLVFPFENSLCNEGINLTPTESTVLFEWEPNTNADVYTLTVENLATNSISQFDTVDFIFPVVINRAAPYRWSVEYNHQGETKQSALWNFYNAGLGIQNYTPFPAEIVSPAMAQTIPSTNSLTLEWNGSDLDDDIVNYDVYLGIENPPSVNATDVNVNQLTVSVTPGTIYYWYVVTKDAAGNSSESGVYQFSISN